MHSDPLADALALREAIEGAAPIALPSPRLRRSLRQRWGLSQDDAALAVGVRRLQISRYETGQQAPQADVAERYSKLMGLLSSLDA